MVLACFMAVAAIDWYGAVGAEHFLIPREEKMFWLQFWATFLEEFAKTGRNLRRGRFRAEAVNLRLKLHDAPTCMRKVLRNFLLVTHQRRQDKIKINDFWLDDGIRRSLLDWWHINSNYYE